LFVEANVLGEQLKAERGTVVLKLPVIDVPFDLILLKKTVSIHLVLKYNELNLLKNDTSNSFLFLLNTSQIFIIFTFKNFDKKMILAR
jgi:hypothetical protein